MIKDFSSGQPQTFKPWTVQPKIGVWVLRIHGWNFQGWEVWGWRLRLKSLAPCRSVWKINLEQSNSKNCIFSLFQTDLIFTACVVCKNQLRHWFLQAKNPVCRTWVFQFDFSKFKYRSTRGLTKCFLVLFITGIKASGAKSQLLTYVNGILHASLSASNCLVQIGSLSRLN